MDPLPETRFAFNHRPSGVYFLLWRGKVIYVGQSTNVFARVSTHWNEMLQLMKGTPIKLNGRWPVVRFRFDEVRLKWVKEELLDAEEFKFIQQYQPKYNVKLNRPVLESGTHLADFAPLAKLMQDHATVEVKEVEPRRRLRHIPGPTLEEVERFLPEDDGWMQLSARSRDE